MSYSEIQQQREYIDQIRQEESFKAQFRDRNGIEQYLEIGLFINERIHKTQLRIYEDCSVEKLDIGNDISELNFDQGGVKDENQQYIRPILNYKNKFTRCHINLSQAQTIAIIIEYNPIYFYQILQKVCKKYQLYNSQLGDEYMWNFLGNQGKIQIMTLARQHQQVILNDQQLIVPGDQTELPFDQFSLKYRTGQNKDYHLQFQICQEVDFDQMFIHEWFIHVDVKMNNSFYFLKLLKQQDDIKCIPEFRIGYDLVNYNKQEIRKYKVQGGNYQALKIKIFGASQQNKKYRVWIENLIPDDTLKYYKNDQFQVEENYLLIIYSNKIKLQYIKEGVQIDDFEIYIK